MHNKKGRCVIKSEFIIERSGKQFVLFQGLLDEAHQQGLKRISTTIIQIPHEENRMTAIVAAEVETGKGVFSDIGDANPENVGRMIIPHIIRMASTRAKARALRDAVNVGVTALEELGDFEEEGDERTSNGAARSSSESPRDSGGIPKASPYKPASANQLATVAKLSRLLGEPIDAPESMTSAEASELITDLSRQYNERKGAPSRR